MSSLTDLAQRWRDDRNRSGIDIDVRTIPAWLLRLTLVVAVFVGGIVAHGELIPALVATIVLAAFPTSGCSRSPGPSRSRARSGASRSSSRVRS